MADQISGSTRSIAIRGDIGIVDYGPTLSTLDRMTNTEWTTLPSSAKADVTQRYVHQYRWADFRPDDGDLSRLTTALTPFVDEYFTRYVWGNRVRILAAESPR